MTCSAIGAFQIGRCWITGAPLQASRLLADNIGAKLTLRFDPEDLHSAINVYDGEGRFIGEAEPLEIAGFDSVEAARTHGNKRRDYLRTLREAEAIQNAMSLDDYLKLVPEAGEPAPKPETKTVRIVKMAGGRDLEILPQVGGELSAPETTFDFDAFGCGITLNENDKED